MTSESALEAITRLFSSSLSPGEDALVEFRHKKIWVAWSGTTPLLLVESDLEEPATPFYHKNLIFASRRFVINNGETAQYLVVAPKEVVAPEIFLSFVRATILELEGISSIKDLISLVLDRYDEWSAFFGSGNFSPNLLSRCTGLYGELYVLRMFVTQSDSSAIEGWWGPARHRHDFEYNTFAAEVKTTLNPIGYSIDVHGINQLTPGKDRPVYLLHLKLSLDPKGENLQEIVSALTKCGVPAWHLTEKIDKSGLKFADLVDYSDFRIGNVTLIPYLVDENFPSITKAHLPSDVLDRVSNLSYSLNLQGVLPIEDTPSLSPSAEP